MYTQYRQHSYLLMQAQGMQHLMLLVSLLIVALPGCDRLNEADSLYKQAEKALGQCLGHRHPALALVLTDWGVLKAASGHSQQATQLLK